MKKQTAWNNLHNFYRTQSWIDNPNIFAEEIIKYIKEGSRILDLGAGQGQDTRYFASKGFEVVSTDISDSALEVNRSKLTDDIKDKVIVQRLNIEERFPFNNSEFNVVYAHLSLHYFTLQKTKEIFGEIARVLKDDGMLVMLNNSITDPEYGQGKLIETDYYFIKDKNKRFFSTASLQELVKPYFSVVLLDAQGETYKDAEKGVHNLIRFIGRKSHQQPSYKQV
jgi:ubiquinone/menaquinone biosynthesis C-methylase UbiE